MIEPRCRTRTPTGAAPTHLELAPFDSEQWPSALSDIVTATNCRFAHLICIGERSRRNHVPPELYSRDAYLDEHDTFEWHAAGGTDPARNIYMAATLGLKPGEDINAPEIFAKHGTPDPTIDWLLRKNDAPNFSASCLLLNGRASWYLACLRSERQGAMPDLEHMRFRRLSRAAGRAILAADAIRNEGNKLLVGAFNSLSITVFALDTFGQVLAMSEKAEALLGCGAILRLRHSTLQARTRETNAAFERAILFAARHQPGTAPDPHACVPLTDSTGQVAATAQAIPLPRDRCDIGLGAAALLIVEERPVNDPRVLAQRFGLTGAEANVAGLLLQRLSVEEIADRRNVSRETVRSQSKAVYAKAGVRSQREFIARLATID